MIRNEMAKVRALKEAQGARVYPQNVAPLGNAPFLFTLFKLTYSQHRGFGRGDTIECANPVLGLYTDMWRIKGPFSTWRHVAMCRNPKSVSIFSPIASGTCSKFAERSNCIFVPYTMPILGPFCYLNSYFPAVRQSSPSPISKSTSVPGEEHPEMEHTLRVVYSSRNTQPPHPPSSFTTNPTLAI